MKDSGSSNRLDDVTTNKSYPLSPVQEGILYHTRIDHHPGLYIIQVVGVLPEKIDSEAMERSWSEVLKQHPVFRTSFHHNSKFEHWQQVHEDVPVPWKFIDALADCPNQKFDEFAMKDRTTPFDLARPPLARLTLVRKDDADFRLVLTVHHVIIDARSIQIILRELILRYRNRCSKGNLAFPPPRPYGDYIGWLGRKDHSTSEEFWRTNLEGFSAETPLVVKRTSYYDPNDSRHNRVSVALSLDASAQLLRIADQYQISLNVFLIGAWGLLLQRYSGELDVVFGIVRNGRPRELSSIESMVGIFINTLPFRARIAPSQQLISWLKELDAHFSVVRKHQHFPLRNIKALSAVPGSKPLFETIINFENLSLDTHLRMALDLESNYRFDLVSPTSYPLCVSASLDKQLQLQLNYDSRFFEHDTISRMMGHLKTLLQEMTLHPERNVSDLEMLSREERHQLLVEWNTTSRPYPAECLHQLVEAQVARTPNAIAVEFEQESLTYSDLNRRANQLAHHLIRQGIGPDSMVGICLERSLEMAIGLLGILKAGGAYVPLDPAYPRERLEFMVDECSLSLILSKEKHNSLLQRFGKQVLCLDSSWSTLTNEAANNPAVNTNPSNLAYVIYTSGSTGKPKGVMLRHRGICSFLRWRCEYFPLTPEDRLLHKASFCFDDSVWEIFEPLIAGARVVMARPGGERDTEYLIQTIHNQRITAASFVPSLLNIFLGDRRVCDTLRRVATGGEVLTRELQNRFHARCSGTLYNGYGPTEATIASTFWTCERDQGSGPIPIGRPVANTEIYLLDANRQLVPIGVPGEIYIGGVGVAKGYLNRPELTGERFVPHPFHVDPEARLYRTGDIARYRPDGNIEFVGRVDNQVKIRGFRIELGEIENALLRHSSVAQAAVVTRAASSGHPSVIAYVVPTRECTLTTGELREFLMQSLPDYMLPNAIQFLEEFPLNSSGKLDRNVLAKINAQEFESDRPHVAARDKIEEQIVGIWEEILDVTPIGVTDDFFVLGGDSILVERCISQIEKVFQVELSSRAFYERPIIVHVAQKVRNTAMQVSMDHKEKHQGNVSSIFMIHGGAEAFTALLQTFGANHSVHYLAPGPAEVKWEDQSKIEQLAQLYLEEILRLQAQPPYLIGGISMGGIIALEVARRLDASGEDVLLCMVAPSTPGIEFAVNSESLVAKATRHWRVLSKQTPMLKLKYISKRIKFVFGPVRLLSIRFTQRYFGRVPSRWMHIWVGEVYRQYGLALRNYTAEPFTVPTLLIADDLIKPEDILKWQNLADDIEILRLPSAHHEVILQPHLDSWLQRLAGWLHSRKLSGKRLK